MSTRRWVATGAVAGILLASTARADPSTQDKAAAQSLFEEGRELVEHGHLAEACPKLAESQRLDPGTGTLLWLADCLEQNGQTASAWAAFSEAAASAAAAHDRRETIARERASKLAGNLSRVRIVVPQEAASQGLVVQRDGRAIGATEWDTPVPADPGLHTISASAPGRKNWSITLDLPPRPETLQVTVPALELDEPAPAPVPASTPALIPAPEPPPAPAPFGVQRTVAVGTGALGLLGLGVGAYLAFEARSTYDGSTASHHCSVGNVCDATGLQQRQNAYDQATEATVAIGVGAAAVVGGGILYLMAPRSQVAVGAAPTSHGGAAMLSLRW